MNDTIRATIKTTAGRLTAELRTHADGEHEGEIDLAHVAELVDEIRQNAGAHPAPELAVDLEPIHYATSVGVWAFAIVDAADPDGGRLGTLEIHAGAGA